MFRMWIVSGSSGYVSANHHIYHTFIVHFLRLNILLNRLVVFAFDLPFVCCIYSLTSIGMEVVNVGVSNSSCFFIFNICDRNENRMAIRRNITNCAYCSFSLLKTENIGWTLLKALETTSSQWAKYSTNLIVPVSWAWPPLTMLYAWNATRSECFFFTLIAHAFCIPMIFANCWNPK